MGNVINIRLNLLILLFYLMFLENICFAAHTNLLNVASNRLAAAAAGQITCQHLDITDTQSLVQSTFKSGFAIAVLDVLARRVISELLDSPAQSYSGMLMTTGSSITRAMVSGLLYSYLLRQGAKMSPTVYSGLYAVVDTLVTGGVNIKLYGSERSNYYFGRFLTSNCFWQGVYAMTFSAVGRGVARCFPSHRYAANIVTQMTLMYATAVVIIMSIMISATFTEFD